MSKSPKSSKKTVRPNRSVARLCAVQALYAIRMSEASQDEVLADFHINRIPEITGEAGFQTPDSEFFNALVKGCEEQASDLDDLLSAVLADDWPLERLEALLHMLLRAAFFELGFCPEVPVKVVIINNAFKRQINTMKGRLGERMLRRLRYELFDRILRFPIAWHAN